MKKYFIIISTALTFALLGTACKKDKDDVVIPNDPNEAEMITTILLSATNIEKGSKATGLWKDTDGDGIPNIMDSLVMEKNSIYNVELLVLNELSSPVDTISHEIEEEATAHQFFYTPIGTDLRITIKDLDKNKVPLGLKTEITTSAEGKGQIRILLKHQPEDKPVSGEGDPALGATDIDIQLPVAVR